MTTRPPTPEREVTRLRRRPVTSAQHRTARRCSGQADAFRQISAPKLQVKAQVRCTSSAWALFVLWRGEASASNGGADGAFNAAVDRFLADVERGVWRLRDPRSR
jgi:hypothetical protein